jgi:hypothetical protein
VQIGQAVAAVKARHAAEHAAVKDPGAQLEALQKRGKTIWHEMDRI